MTHISEATRQLHIELANYCGKIAALFKNPKVTIIVRNPDLPDGDVMVGDDAPESVIAAIERLEQKSELSLVAKPPAKGSVQ